MKNGERENRVERAVLEWKNREERYSSLFGFNVASSRLLSRDKLIYYDKIANKFSGTMNLEEKHTLRMLDQERKNLEKRLYPNRLLRFLRRILVRVIWTGASKRGVNRKLNQEASRLHDEVGNHGFDVNRGLITKQIVQDKDSFDIPMSPTYVSEDESMGYSLHFAKDGTGQYGFEGYRATLQNDKLPGQDKSQLFKVNGDSLFSERDAYNLLSGRAALRAGKWIQLEFNDCSAEGEHRMKEFNRTYNYDLDKILSELPIKEKDSSLEKGRLQRSLEKGERSAVTFLKDGHEQRFYLEADPAKKTVTIYDQHSKKITLNALNGVKQVGEGLKVAQKASKIEISGKRTGLKVN